MPTYVTQILMLLPIEDESALAVSLHRKRGGRRTTSITLPHCNVGRLDVATKSIRVEERERQAISRKLVAQGDEQRPVAEEAPPCAIAERMRSTAA